MVGFRADRVAEQIKKEVSDIILNQVKDPRIQGLITITGVNISKDLRYTKVYISIYGSEEKKQEVFDVLKSAEGFIRREIGKRVRLKFTPEVVLQLDESIEYGINIALKLKEIDSDKKEVKPNETGTNN